jgi:DNA modification methylase
MYSLLAQPNIWIDEPVKVYRGDIWQLGQHKLVCGDSASVEDVARLFDSERFALCFTSPPYSDQRTYKLGSFDWHSLMCGAFDQMIARGLPDCHILINLGLSHKNRQVDMYWLEWLMYCKSVGWPVFGWYVWDKGAGFPGEWYGRLAPAYEFVFHFNQQTSITNKWIPTTVERGCRTFREKDGSTRRAHSPDKIAQPYKIPDAVIRINREKARGIQDNHPAVFPVALPEFIMRTWSQPGDIVYEPFCGSGTSLIAGENLKRRVFACDIQPSYAELAIIRWQQHTGLQPVLLERSGN